MFTSVYLISETCYSGSDSSFKLDGTFCYILYATTWNNSLCVFLSGKIISAIVTLHLPTGLFTYELQLILILTLVSLGIQEV